MRGRSLLLLAMLAPAVGHGQTASHRPEPVVKAQFFERFTRFVEWPAPPPGPRSTFTVCLTGADALSREIELLAGRLPFKGRPTRVRYLGSGATQDPAG